MRTFPATPPSALALVALLALGCAYGGGRDDDDVDAGPDIRRDGGPSTGVDSGPSTGVDSGPSTGVDSGPSTGVDSGPSTGTDAGGGSCPVSPCRLSPPQCGCPSGQGCYLDSSNDPVCGTPGPETEGQACTGTTACRPGLLCIGLDGNNFCSRLCASDTDCTAGPGSICLLTLNDGSGGDVPGVTLCTQQCDPTSTTPSGCPSGLGCAIYEESEAPMRLFTGCRAAGTAGTGALCSATEDCATGHFCPESLGECVPYCTGVGSSCGVGRLCNAFDPPVVIGTTEYGYCY